LTLEEALEFQVGTSKAKIHLVGECLRN